MLIVLVFEHTLLEIVVMRLCTPPSQSLPDLLTIHVSDIYHNRRLPIFFSPYSLRIRSFCLSSQLVPACLGFYALNSTVPRKAYGRGGHFRNLNIQRNLSNRGYHKSDFVTGKLTRDGSFHKVYLSYVLSGFRLQRVPHFSQGKHPLKARGS